MLSPRTFIETLARFDIDFFTGVPDSLLKNVCAYITDHLPKDHHIIAANEGGAVGLAAGYHLATGKIAAVYMQNSGEGNSINPLLSLTDKEVYNIPLLLIIGWRGEPGIKDEPQHVKQGKVTCSLLEAMGIEYQVLAQEEDEACRQIEQAVAHVRQTHEAFALVVRKDTFAPYTLRQSETQHLEMSREEAIGIVAERIEHNAVVVATTGMISRELFECRNAAGESHERDFLSVGAMGHASQIALGLALRQQQRRVYCFDGDGATIMHMGNLAIVADMRPRNYVHVIFNNGAHDSVGGQPTVGLNIDLPAVAKAVGYVVVQSVETASELRAALAALESVEGPVLLEVKVKKGARKDLGRPTSTPLQNKLSLMDFLKQ